MFYLYLESTYSLLLAISNVRLHYDYVLPDWWCPVMHKRTHTLFANLTQSQQI